MSTMNLDKRYSFSQFFDGLYLHIIALGKFFSIFRLDSLAEHDLKEDQTSDLFVPFRSLFVCLFGVEKRQCLCYVFSLPP